MMAMIHGVRAGLRLISRHGAHSANTMLKLIIGLARGQRTPICALIAINQLPDVLARARDCVTRQSGSFVLWSGENDPLMSHD